MATGCEKCTPDDVARLEEVQKAKTLANEIQSPVAVYKVGTKYKHIKAEIAINERFPIIQIISVGTRNAAKTV